MELRNICLSNIHGICSRVRDALASVHMRCLP